MWVTYSSHNSLWMRIDIQSSYDLGITTFAPRVRNLKPTGLWRENLSQTRELPTMETSWRLVQTEIGGLSKVEGKINIVQCLEGNRKNASGSSSELRQHMDGRSITEIDEDQIKPTLSPRAFAKEISDIEITSDHILQANATCLFSWWRSVMVFQFHEAWRSTMQTLGTYTRSSPDLVFKLHISREFNC